MNKGKRNNRLRAAIILKYGTQADFAVAANIDESELSRIILGRRPIDKPRQREWAKLLKKSVSEIF